MNMKDFQLTKKQIDLLMFLRQNSEKTFSHKQLSDLGFSINVVNQADFFKCAKRNGYNEQNFTYKITDAGIAYCEEFEKRAEKESDEKQYRDKSLEIAKRADNRAFWANIISILSVVINILLYWFFNCRK